MRLINADALWKDITTRIEEYCDIADLIDIIERQPTIEPERLTDDDLETIRIHLNAYKEKLCNQHRWEEAEEYQRIINRLMACASAESEIIRCKDCCHYPGEHSDCTMAGWFRHDDDYCSRAEKRTDE